MLTHTKSVLNEFDSQKPIKVPNHVSVYFSGLNKRHTNKISHTSLAQSLINLIAK